MIEVTNMGFGSRLGVVMTRRRQDMNKGVPGHFDGIGQGDRGVTQAHLLGRNAVGRAVGSTAGAAEGARGPRKVDGLAQRDDLYTGLSLSWFTYQLGDGRGSPRHVPCIGDSAASMSVLSARKPSPSCCVLAIF